MRPHFVFDLDNTLAVPALDARGETRVARWFERPSFVEADGVRHAILGGMPELLAWCAERGLVSLYGDAPARRTEAFANLLALPDGRRLASVTRRILSRHDVLDVTVLAADHPLNSAEPFFRSGVLRKDLRMLGRPFAEGLHAAWRQLRWPQCGAEQGRRHMIDAGMRLEMTSSVWASMETSVSLEHPENALLLDAEPDHVAGGQERNYVCTRFWQASLLDRRDGDRTQRFALENAGFIVAALLDRILELAPEAGSVRAAAERVMGGMYGQFARRGVAPFLPREQLCALIARGHHVLGLG